MTRENGMRLGWIGAGRMGFAPAALADRDIVFTMVGGDRDFQQVVLGEGGVLSRDGVAPRVLVDSTTISAGASQVVREAAEARGTAVLAAPGSGNPQGVAARGAA